MNVPRRYRLLAFFLPVAGLFLIMPPFVFVFDHPGTVLGIPVIIAFLFGVWALMILGTRWLQKKLIMAEPTTEQAEGGGDDLG